jgi:hypothetical protein
VGSLKVNLDETKFDLKSTKILQDSVLERIEKLESDDLLMKDEFDGKLERIGKELGGFKDFYLKKSQFEE